MAKHVSIAVCLTLGTAFFIGAGCSSIPDSRKTLPSPDGGMVLPDGGETGGSTGNGGSGAGGAAGSGAGAGGAAGKGSGGNGTGGKGGGNGGATSAGGSGSGGRMMSIDGGPDAAVGIPCGSNLCADRPVGRTTYPACCAGPKQDRCGVDTTVNGGPGCIEPDQAGVLDPICADMDSTDGNTTYSGCCRPEGKCGVQYQLSGAPNFGCVDPTELGLAAGKDCTPAECTAAGKACQKASECCPGPAGDPVCATFATTTGAVCSDYCNTNRDCASGCCILLISGRGACAPDAKGCSATCRNTDETCDSDADCCSPNVCAPNSELGPRLCRPKCTTNATCSPEFCAKDEAGRGACSTQYAGLCTDTCRLASDGSCDDGGPMWVTRHCAIGSDCSDCGGAAKVPRLGGTSYCFDSCTTKNNKKCEDGGPNAVAGSCAFGTDCTDCGPRLGLCSDDCEYAKGGTCDDGGPGAGYSGYCSFGSDCSDCGVRFGGRGQGVCDGSKGSDCVPHGGIDNSEIEDNDCECADCPWDVVDCKVTATKCDGKSIGACCAPGNPCHLPFDDGICICGGWCDWETPDCGDVFPPPKCDGTKTGCDLLDPNTTFKTNNVCDCGGGCSWESAQCTTVLGKRTCTDTCKSADDGTCDDGGKCAYGTDCADCGPRWPKAP